MMAPWAGLIYWVSVLTVALVVVVAVWRRGK